MGSSHVSRQCTRTRKKAAAVLREKGKKGTQQKKTEGREKREKRGRGGNLHNLNSCASDKKMHVVIRERAGRPPTKLLTKSS